MNVNDDKASEAEAKTTASNSPARIRTAREFDIAIEIIKARLGEIGAELRVDPHNMTLWMEENMLAGAVKGIGWSIGVDFALSKELKALGFPEETVPQ